MQQTTEACEAFVRARIAAGEIADFTQQPGYTGARENPLSSAFLRRLMLGLEDARVLAPGVRIRGASLIGDLDLRDCVGLGALALEACDIPGTIDISGAELVRFSFDDSHYRAVIAVGVRIAGDFTFRNAEPLAFDDAMPVPVQADPASGDAQPTAPKPTGYVRLRNARIDGVISGRGATLRAPDEGHPLSSRAVDAFELSNSDIGGSLLLDECKEVVGAIWMMNARIKGNVSLDGVTFQTVTGNAIIAQDCHIGGTVTIDSTVLGEIHFKGAQIAGSFLVGGMKYINEGGDTLYLANASIGGDLIFNIGFESHGRVCIQATKIRGNVDCDGALFINPEGTAIEGTNAEISGDVFMRQGFEAKGRVVLHGARIGRNFEIADGKLLNLEGDCLVAPNLDVGGDVMLGDESVFEGRVRLSGSSVARDIFVTHSKFKAPERYALCLPTVNVTGQLLAWHNEFDGYVDLEGAHVGRLFDNPDTAWGSDMKQKIDLNEFNYDLIGKAPGATTPMWKARAVWLRRNTGDRVGKRAGFSNHPYRQLAAAMERAGFQADARRISRAEQSEANRHRPLWQRPFVFLFAELPFGYGLSVARAVITIIAFWLIGWLGVTLMDRQGALIQASGDKTVACGEAITPPLYALDIALPIVDLGQESACTLGRMPNNHLFAGIKTPVGNVGEGLTVWRWLVALYSLLGTAVVGFAALTFTGIFKPRGA